jgi:hypothetical protein
MIFLEDVGLMDAERMAIQDRINRIVDAMDPALRSQIAQEIFDQLKVIAPPQAPADTEPAAGPEQGAGVAQQQGAGALSSSDSSPGYRYASPIPELPYPSPFDWTDGIRNFPLPLLPPPSPFAPPLYGPERAAVVTRAGLTTTLGQIYHQPLIQIKMRVVEVRRADFLAVNSVLEYVSDDDTQPSLTSGLTANRVGSQGRQNFRSLTSFPTTGLATQAGMGAGALVNLTTEHVNWLVQALATELSADVITAPEVVTLNGQNVEFVAGEKLPFQLGQNVIQGTNNNIQQVFYKHVGTMVSVTPRIVNWGFHGEGLGEAAIVGNDVLDWSALIQQMLASGLVFQTPTGVATAPFQDIKPLLEKYARQPVVPFSAQAEILKALNDYSKRDLSWLLQLAEMCIIDEDACARCRRWRPEDCTIDLAVVVRLSEGGTVDVSNPDTATITQFAAEKSVRAVANVIQVKSGHGVVMAGLIGEREIEDVATVPVLGDLPVVGFLFRSKAVDRFKTEVLIFIEAQVLDPDPCVARAESSQNFLLSQPYVDGEFLDNPLEYGLYRVGFGTYLPPHTIHESVFWERFGRKIRKIHTHIDDALE